MAPRSSRWPAPRVAWRAVAMIALAAAVAGCASSDYLAVRHTPRNPLAGPLRLLSGKGPRPTPRTVQLLRRYDLPAGRLPLGDKALTALANRIAEEPTAEKVYALAELAYVQAKRADSLGLSDRALDLYGAAVSHAYLYLFDPQFDSERNPYDPQFRRACDVYNGALEAALRLVNKAGRLKPGMVTRVEAGGRTYEVRVVVRGPWPEDAFERFEFVSDYQVKGLTNHHRRYGLGVPLIAVRRSRRNGSPAESFYPPGLAFPVTAFLRVEQQPGGQGGYQAVCRRCLLELYDPVLFRDIRVAGRLVPLESDLSTPLAYFLDSPSFQERDIATLGLLNPNRTASLAGVFMLEPYDPDKIPVLMVHGLWSSPATWMDMFNDLRAFPEIRRRYQFWFYLYPSGQPFWVSAAQLRRDLGMLRAALDPERRNDRLRQMVLVGHSMGGLVAELQIIDSGARFWRLVSDRPFEELQAPLEQRERLARMLFFRPDPGVRRVITIATPHRGSRFANEATRWVGRRLIQLPQLVLDTIQGVVQLNPGAFRNPELLTITTSIDSLAPESPFLPVMLEAPKAPWVVRHNIVGVIPDDGLLGRLTPKGDGVVAFASAHLDDVASELVVPADHMNVHRHPRAILEVRRILLEHLEDVRRERLAAGRAAAPGSF